MKVAALIPSRGLMHSRTADDVFANQPDQIIFSHGRPIPDAMNYLAEKFFETDNDYAWFVDDDMKLPPNALDDLLERATRLTDPADIVFHDYPVHDKHTMKTKPFLRGGFGSILIKRDILRQHDFRTDFGITLDGRTFKRNPDQHGGHDVHFFWKWQHKKVVCIGAVGQYVWEDKPFGNKTNYKIGVWEWER